MASASSSSIQPPSASGEVKGSDDDKGSGIPKKYMVSPVLEVPRIQAEHSRKPFHGMNLFEYPWGNYALIGRRRSGKTVAIYNLIKWFAQKHSMVHLYVSTLHNDETYDHIVKLLEKRKVPMEQSTSMDERLLELFYSLQQKAEEEKRERDRIRMQKKREQERRKAQAKYGPGSIQFDDPISMDQVNGALTATEMLQADPTFQAGLNVQFNAHSNPMGVRVDNLLTASLPERTQMMSVQQASKVLAMTSEDGRLRADLMDSTLQSRAVKEMLFGFKHGNRPVPPGGAVAGDLGLYGDDADDKNKPPEEPEQHIVVIDDQGDALRNTMVTEWLKRSRHFKAITIIATQNLYDLRREALNQMNYVFVYHDTPEDRLIHLKDALNLTIPAELLLKLYEEHASEEHQFLLFDVLKNEIRAGLEKVVYSSKEFGQRKRKKLLTEEEQEIVERATTGKGRKRKRAKKIQAPKATA